MPLPYLVARNLQLLFAILPRTSAATDEIDSVWDALDYALWHLGAGAKTAIGFGIMQTEEQRQRRIELERAEAARQAEASAENWEGALFKYNRKNGMFTAEKDGQTASALGDEGKQRFASLPPDMQRTLQGGRPVRGTARIARQGKEIKLLGAST